MGMIKLYMGRDDKFLQDTLFTYMVAGKDTAGATLVWMLWLVTNNPNVDKKMVEKLRKLRDSSEVINDDEKNDCQRRLASCLVSTKSGHAQGLSSLCIRWEEWRQYGGRSEDCLEVKPERWIMEKGTLKQEPSFKFMHSTQDNVVEPKVSVIIKPKNGLLVKLKKRKRQD
ncbi:alkane hydroxylase MAH1-like [Asparagus officinalis]|uniref:alkane hydroxylase MAH1-like n=1 Tax=Asparagus officinalis TaxID=4686 RepID=UPI00098E68FD|nr:alkane hydroxylase MAH1-like [Asparagus officinalis]